MLIDIPLFIPPMQSCQSKDGPVSPVLRDCHVAVRVWLAAKGTVMPMFRYYLFSKALLLALIALTALL